MGSIVLYMSMSLDGFITGPDDGPGQGLGLNGSRLFRWLDERNTPGPNKDVFDELMATGAVIAGRRTYENADHWQGDHHDGVPVFVLTHHPPETPPPGSVRFATDGADDCAGQAKAAAGERNVMVHGAGAAQSLLRAGVLDELELHLARPARPGRAPIRRPRSRPHRARAHPRDRGAPRHHLHYRVIR
jgi:dihydrofolate reductase